MTQAEEIAYWQGYDAGRNQDDAYGRPCRYIDLALWSAYNCGVLDGDAVRTGQKPEPDLPRPAGAESHWR